MALAGIQVSKHGGFPPKTRGNNGRGHPLGSVIHLRDSVFAVGIGRAVASSEPCHAMMTLYRSFHSGFAFSISLTFQAHLHFFICSSRLIAISAVACVSKVRRSLRLGGSERPHSGSRIEAAERGPTTHGKQLWCIDEPGNHRAWNSFENTTDGACDKAKMTRLTVKQRCGGRWTDLDAAAHSGRMPRRT